MLIFFPYMFIHMAIYLYMHGVFTWNALFYINSQNWNTANVYKCVSCRYLRVTPPFLVRSIQGVFRRYAVRKGSVRSTQKSCYIVRKHLFLLLKGSIFIKKHNKRDIQSQIILNFSRARFARAFWGGGSFQHL